ncbi:MAG: hypothetical protein SGBAC_009630 [Bacillariaceae sp.]
MCISGEKRFAAKRRQANAKMASSNATPEQLIGSAKKDVLLNACLRFDWDQVQHWCGIFSSVLRNKSSNHCDLVRQQLLQQDAWGNTALHAACHFNPSSNILRSILKLAKSTHLHHHLCTLPNANGAIPLVVCCTTGGASLTCMLLLMEEVESKSELCDAKGNSAIGGLLKRYQMLRKVPTFCHSMKPLIEIHSVRANYSILMQQQKSCKRRHSQRSAIPNGIDDMALGGFTSCWTKMELLLKVAWLMDFETLEEWSPLHGAANVASQIPPDLSELLVRCHADFVSTPSNQGGGALPLHLAIAQGTSQNLEEQSHTEAFVQHLIQVDPSTASCPDPRTGQLPLVRAIEEGFWWNSSSSPSSNGGILKQLWTAYPEALDQQDPQTGIYPALLAAIPRSSSELSENQNQRQLDTVFSMLKLNPSIIARKES